MRITQGEIVDLQTVLHIEMEDADIAPYLDIGFRKVRPHITYPGFRKGRVPRHIVMQFVGRETLLNEVLGHDAARGYWQGDGRAGTCARRDAQHGSARPRSRNLQGDRAAEARSGSWRTTGTFAWRRTSLKLEKKMSNKGWNNCKIV